MSEDVIDELRQILRDDYHVELSREQAARYAHDYVAFFGTLAEIALAEKQKLSQNDEDRAALPL